MTSMHSQSKRLHRGTKIEQNDCSYKAFALKSYSLSAMMNEQVIEDYVIYHVKSNDHHAPEEEVGAVNVVYYATYC